jgi:hypothetical protein
VCALPQHKQQLTHLPSGVSTGASLLDAGSAKAAQAHADTAEALLSEVGSITETSGTCIVSLAAFVLWPAPDADTWGLLAAASARWPFGAFVFAFVLDMHESEREGKVESTCLCASILTPVPEYDERQRTAWIWVEK